MSIEDITHKVDEDFILRCISLSEEALSAGENPFGCGITIGNKIIAESYNRAKEKPSYHAEILALIKTQEILASKDLSDCTLYSNCEPCPMCSFMIREYKIPRVVFAVHSPLMGGYSKWNILKDEGLSSVKPYFSSPPAILGGILEDRARAVFKKAGMWMF